MPTGRTTDTTASTATLNLLRHDFISGFPKDAAQTLERMPTEDITAVLGDVDHADSIATWEPPSPDVAQRVLASLPPDQAVKLLGAMESEHAVPILALSDEEQRDAYLDAMTGEDADELRQLLSYPEDSAGAMMDPKVLLLRPESTVTDTPLPGAPAAAARHPGAVRGQPGQEARGHGGRTGPRHLGRSYHPR